MTALALFLLPAFAVLALCRGRLEIGTLIAIGLGQWLAGAWLTRELHPHLFAVCLVGTSAIAVGYALARRREPHGDYEREAGAVVSGRRGALGALSVITVTLVAIHFIRGGVPLFSANVETARFQIANSGLLGIPSRAYLFGLPILVLSYAGLRDRTRREDRMLLLVATAFVASRLLGGLKSGLVEVMFVALIAQVTRTGGEARITSPAVVRRALLGLLAVLFAGYLSTQYATVHTNSVSGAANYLVRRATTGTVSAGAYAVEGHGLKAGGPYLLKDFGYYGNKYAANLPGRLALFTPPQESTSRLISAGLVGLPPDTGEYVSPVAVGLAPSLFLDWGWIGVVVGMTLAGFAVRRLQWRTLRARALTAGIWATSCLVGMYVIVNGGLAYYSINFVATALLYVAAAAVISPSFGRITSEERNTSVGPISPVVGE